jgi:membrane-bound metal-dependent hydrolase YbcI (DUF457 family)
MMASSHRAFSQCTALLGLPFLLPALPTPPLASWATPLHPLLTAFSAPSFWGHPLSVAVVLSAAHLLGAFFSALWPDIDEPRSTLGRRFPWVSAQVASWTRHREATHSVLALVGLALVCGVGATLLLEKGPAWGAVGMAFFSGVWVGMASHVLADFISNSGVALFWPSRTRWGVSLCKTGHPSERAVMGGVVLLTASYTLLVSMNIRGG